MNMPKSQILKRLDAIDEIIGSPTSTVNAFTVTKTEMSGQIGSNSDTETAEGNNET